MNEQAAKGLRMAGIGLLLAAALVPAMLLAWADATHSSKVARPPAEEPISSAVTIDGKRAPWDGAGATHTTSTNPATKNKPAEVSHAVVDVVAKETAASAAIDPASTVEPGSRAVVVELFTSEGCSSCPPAEALLNEMSAAPVMGRARVYAIAHHVDYWDRLGWKDPFASKGASDRQRMYAEIFKDRSVYTPQMVVNGRAGFVGSDRAVAAKEIARAADAEPLEKIEVEVNGWGMDAPLNVAWRLPEVSPASHDDQSASNDADGFTLHAMLVESGLETKVGAGENSGRTLRHDRVVRLMSSMRIADGVPQGTIQLALNERVGAKQIDPDRAAIVVLIQRDHGRGFVGVGETVIKQEDTSTDAATAATVE